MIEAITIKGLSKSYATRDGDVLALDRISAGVAEGEFVAVVGHADNVKQPTPIARTPAGGVS